MTDNTFSITNTVTVPIRGVKKERVFLHVSDAHVAFAYPDDSQAEHEHAKKQTALWTQSGIAPINAFKSFIALANDKKPDGVFLVGDMIDYYSASNVKYLEELLGELDSEYVYTWGNHENGSYGLPLPSNEEMRQTIAPLMHGCTDFYVKDHDDFLLVAIDNSGFDIDDTLFGRVEQVIATGRPIILLMHVPISTPKFDKVAWSTLDKDERTKPSAIKFAQMLRNSDNIVCIIAGHEHFAWCGEFAPGRYQYVSAPCFKRFVQEIRVVPWEDKTNT